MKYFNVTAKAATATSQTTLEFMVDFTMPERLSDDFIARVPHQRKLINRYMKNRKLLSYALSLESQKMWAIFRVESEFELMELLADLPLTSLMELNISSLSVLNTAKEDINEVCLN
jgi:muconolactone delta-isomerase